MRYIGRTNCAVAVAVVVVLGTHGAADEGKGHTHGAATKKVSVTGHLFYSDGRPVVRIPVVIRGKDESRQSYRAITAPDGRFEFRGLPKGSYRFFAIRVYVNGKKGLCEELGKRDILVADAMVDLGKLTLEKRTVPPVRK